jgi:hypothetical protein
MKIIIIVFILLLCIKLTPMVSMQLSFLKEQILLSLTLQELKYYEYYDYEYYNHENEIWS